MIGGHDHRRRIVILLTPNDVGSTGSHQAGVHVPKSMVRYFPGLSQHQLNPDAWIIVSDGARTWRWRYIHYNNGVVAEGTRDEFRLTHTREFLRAHGASPGERLVLACLGTEHAAAEVVADAPSDQLVLFTDGRWTVTNTHRAR